MKIVAHDILCRTGDGDHQEDVAFLKVWEGDRFLLRGGAGDGATVPHNESHPLEFYNGKTGAELASQIYKKTCEEADPLESLGRILFRANDSVRLLHQVLLDLEGTEPGSKLHGLCFGAFEVKPMWTRIVWAGDAQVFVRFKDGTVWMTENELREHDAEMYALVRLYTKQAAKALELDPYTQDDTEKDRITNKMWEFFYEPLCRARDERINTDYPKSYSLMNGHPSAPERWRLKKFYTPHIELIGAATDGLFQPRSEFAALSDEEAAKRLLESVEKWGLEGYADRLEEYERQKPAGHVRIMEKAGVLVRLG